MTVGSGTDRTGTSDGTTTGAVDVPAQAGGVEGFDGPLDAATSRRVMRASVAIVSTSDVHGDRDVTVLAGGTCVLRVLDARHVAWPDEGFVAASAYRANLAEAPDLAIMLLGVGEGGGRSGLHLNGTAAVVPATDLRVAHPDLPADPVPGRATDVWVVTEVGDAYALDDDEVPPVGLLRSAAPPSSPAPSGHTGNGSRRLVPALVIVLLALLLAAAIVGVALSSLPTGPAPPPPAAAPPVPAAPAGPTGPATLYGRVVDVPDPATVVVDVAGRPLRVGVIGLDAAAVPACARSASLAFARTTLQGQTVTLVPDPTLPPSPAQRAYVVLGSQLSYTDAAIRGGHAPSAGASQYRRVFDGEQADAREAGVGLWGPPCVR